MSDPNVRYANTFIDALVAAGLRRVCVAPGSRHTPLVLALARRRDVIDLSSHLDERSAAFFALGLALGSDEPAAIVCTSGSAAANLFPAIVEARQARVPLIVLTADRPHELRGSGANQTIDQVKLYGDYVDWFYDAPLPEADPPPVALRQMRTLAARAYHIARTQNGVVHINFPFRKPLEPAPAEYPQPFDRRPVAQLDSQARKAATGLPQLLEGDLLRSRGIIYCGHDACRSEAERAVMQPWLAALARATGYPVLTETSSNLRAGSDDYQPIATYESLLETQPSLLDGVEVVIRLGAPPLCKAMQDFMARAQLHTHIHLSRAGAWVDDSHTVTHLLDIAPADLSASEWRGMTAATSSWARDLQNLDAAARDVITNETANGAYFDGAALYDVVDLMPAGGTLFAGNSLPVRHLDQFGLPRGKPALCFGNRGASGIDGNVSTALGIGAARRHSPLVAVLGDITLYHDMNGLLAINRCNRPVTIVLLNNDGGGIFQRLPIRQFQPEFSDFFVTPHGLDFARVAALYDLNYIRADDRGSFRSAFSQSVGGGDSTLIEVRTDARQDLRRRSAIMAALKQRMR